MRATMEKMIAMAGLIVLTAWAMSLADECPDLVGTDCGGGYSWFGLRHDGANIGQGQSFLLECASTLFGVEIVVRNVGNDNNGVPPMVAGDPIYLAIADMDINILATSETTMPFDVGEAWIEFAFDLGLEAGNYVLLSYTDVPRQASIGFCTEEDSYENGRRYGSNHGGDGPWSPSGTDSDTPFWLHLEPDETAAEASNWSSVKALYH